MRRLLTERILREADLDGQIEAAYHAREEALATAATTLHESVVAALAETPTDPWSRPIEKLAAELCADLQGGEDSVGAGDDR
jgi:hypothetical protein